jgi:hypothetical protein
MVSVVESADGVVEIEEAGSRPPKMVLWVIGTRRSARRSGNLYRVRVGVRSAFVIVLLTAFDCSTHTAPRTINVSVSLVRGDQFVPGRVSASLPGGTAVASKRQSGRPTEPAVP